MSDEERKKQARKIAEERYGFRIHLPVYVLINGGLVGIWLYTGGFPWPLFVIGFWGIGLVSHYFKAYRRAGKRWIEKETEKIERELEKEKMKT